MLVVGSGGWCNGMDPDGASFAEMHQPSMDPATDPLALDQATVERLLAGELVGEQVPVGYGQVAALLAAVVAPPSPQELAGQAAVLAQLRAVTRHRSAVGSRVGAAARSGRAGRPARRRRRRVGLAVVVVVGALSTGGVAAATGQLPGSIRDAARNLRTMVGGPAVPTETGPGRRPAPTGTTGGDGQGVDGQGARPAGEPGVGSRVVPGVAADGLCRAFLAGRGGVKGNRVDAAAFQALARAAGGPDKIVAFCQGVQPGSAEPDKQKPDKPPRTSGNEDHGPGGPPPDPGGGNQGQGGPPGTRPNDP